MKKKVKTPKIKDAGDALLKLMGEVVQLRCCGNCKHESTKKCAKIKQCKVRNNKTTYLITIKYLPNGYCKNWKNDSIPNKDRERLYK